MLNLKNHKIFLASKSPRRSELLAQAGIPFEIFTKDVEEIYPNDLNVYRVPEFLAKLKADASVEVLNTDFNIIISADSVVICNEGIIGKPKDYDDAKTIIAKLSNNWHTVVTGVCIKSISKEVVFSERAEVLFYPLSSAEIEYYVETFKPLDKAGAYGIQDWIGLCKVKEIKGNFSNIMGLPMSKLYHELERFIG
jgi:septum formation protein